jgi:hypothetical protein
MAYLRQEFYIDYFDKEYLDFQFPDRKNVPHFQLSEGDVGGSDWGGGDPHEGPSHCYAGISDAHDFPGLALDILKCLKRPSSLGHAYQVRLTENASSIIGKTGKEVLEEILALHNDIVTPRRSYKKESY